MSPRPLRAFSLVELLIVVAILALLVSILLPSLGHARRQAQAVVCGSNLRQLLIANAGYAAENRDHYCPAAAGMITDKTNLHRWHGTRAAVGQPFDAARGPLVRYITASDGPRTCPTFDDFRQAGGFELGTGGYGYNHAFVGQIVEQNAFGAYHTVTDWSGVRSHAIARPTETVMFADAAFAAPADGVVEYSFIEPRFHPAYPWARMDPSIHFRHNGHAQAGWSDGHVDRQTRTFTHQSTLYPGDPGAQDIGWFGLDDSNRLFDLE